jgi:hypothetical protein
MIKNYDSFVLENKIYSLLLESQLIYSKKFINILNRIKDNNVAKALLDLYTIDIEDLKHNYLDVSDKKDKVIFTQDKRIQNFLKEKKEVWKVVDSQRYLTHSDKNNTVFNILGYNKEENEIWIPQTGQKGIILKETVRPSGRIYVLFEEYTDNDKKRLCVLNKESIVLDVENEKVWNLNRSEIAVGRLANAILKAANLDFKNKEIEDFVNLYKSTHDLINDMMSNFEEVSGDDIAYWYRMDNYESGGGTLNSSCMAEVEDYFFDIYTQNPQVKLIIFKSEYNTNKIKGRALLWDVFIDGVQGKFMDRIYTRYDSDFELFKQYAQKNKYWYKSVQDMNQNGDITDGKTTKDAYIYVKLDNSDFDYYPYMDTLSYIDTDKDTCSNNYHNATRSARDTDGSWEELDY